MGDRVIVVGGGAREHALIWKLAQSPEVDSILATPGNPGTAIWADNVALDVLNIDGITSLAIEQAVDLVVIGPEAPLAAGLGDALRTAGLAVCGPTQRAARIESSKSWAKALMVEADIPTAHAVTISAPDEISANLSKFNIPVVLKADGLAAGKGVVIAESHEEAEKTCRAMLQGNSPGIPAGSVLVEEHLSGQEVSLLALTDGTAIVPLLPACDYKRAYDHDQGANTGGMGGYAPPPVIDDAMIEKITETILRPVIQSMTRAGAPMQGVLYAGLMMTADGPKIIEFNARFGDPETQIILPLLDSDLYPLLRATATGGLADLAPPRWKAGAAVGVVMASAGYPGPYETGVPIDDEGPVASTEVFFAGVKSSSGGGLLTSGGRVLTAVGTGPTFEEARALAYQRVERISFSGAEFRSDIALRELHT